MASKLIVNYIYTLYFVECVGHLRCVDLSVSLAKTHHEQMHTYSSSINIIRSTKICKK